MIDVDFDGEELTFKKGTGSIPEPRKRDTIAQEAELLLKGYDFNNTGAHLGGPAQSGGAAD